MNKKEQPVQRGFSTGGESFQPLHPGHFPEHSLASFIQRPVISGDCFPHIASPITGYEGHVTELGIPEVTEEMIEALHVDYRQLEWGKRIGGPFWYSNTMRKNPRLIADFKQPGKKAQEEELPLVVMPAFGTVWIWGISPYRNVQKPSLGYNEAISCLGDCEWRKVYSGCGEKRIACKYLLYKPKGFERAPYLKQKEQILSRAIDLTGQPQLEFGMNLVGYCFEPRHLGQILAFETGRGSSQKLELYMIIAVYDEENGIRYKPIRISQNYRDHVPGKPMSVEWRNLIEYFDDTFYSVAIEEIQEVEGGNWTRSSNS